MPGNPLIRDDETRLIGRPDGRLGLATPSLLIDRGALDRNIARMAGFCRANAIALRPHAKTHKSAEIAKRQLAAGAVGICCAKLSEAEALAAQGIEAILITSPIIGPRNIQRLLRLSWRLADLIIVVDDPAAAAALNAASAAERQVLKVLLDLDTGMHRTGLAGGPRAVELAKIITGAPALSFAGLQAYAGDLQHIADPVERKIRADDVAVMVAGQRDALARYGIACPVITGGGTGTAPFDAESGVFTELQAGSYIFMDRQYDEIGYRPGDPCFEPSLFVQTTVISANTPGHVTTDAGLKAFATDDGPPVVMNGPQDAQYSFFGDEHGRIALPLGGSLPLGTVVLAQPPHCDPTVNLYDAYHVVEGDRLVAIWPVTARGCSY